MKKNLLSATLSRKKLRTGSSFVSIPENEKLSRDDWFLFHKEKFERQDRRKLIKFFDNLDSYLASNLRASERAGNEETGKTLTKEAIRSRLQLDNDNFDILYGLMGAASRKKVSKERCILLLYAIMRNNADDADFAFTLFDTFPQLNRNAITKREFTEMIALVINNNMQKLFTILKGRECFFLQLQSEHSEELFLFHEQVSELMQRKVTVPVDKAWMLFKNYLEVGSKFQINISHPAREEIRTKLELAMKRKNKGSDVDPSIFKNAKDEIIVMLQETFQRFMKRILIDNSVFVDIIWDALQIPPAQEMLTREKFLLWSQKNPGFFHFLDKSQKALLRVYGEKIGNVIELVTPSSI